MSKLSIKADDLAYWYLRLNGFLTTHNFVVHDDSHAAQRTDVDILGVRFPFRNEIKMPDDTFFIINNKKPLFIITEVTKSQCKLNGPWTDPEKQNMQRVLKSLGAFKKEMINAISDSLYAIGYYECDEFRINIICIGGTVNDEIKSEKPNVEQILFNHILKFIHERFKKFHKQKQDHQHWDKNGKLLWEIYDLSRSNIDIFIDLIEIT